MIKYNRRLTANSKKFIPPYESCLCVKFVNVPPCLLLIKLVQYMIHTVGYVYHTLYVNWIHRSWWSASMQINHLSWKCHSVSYKTSSKLQNSQIMVAIYAICFYSEMLHQSGTHWKLAFAPSHGKKNDQSVRRNWAQQLREVVTTISTVDVWVALVTSLAV